VPVALASKCENGTRGARDLRNAIRRSVEDKIANLIVENAESPLKAVALSVTDGEIVLTSM
jgi:ATP-dependent Clp protease ATP-binding subunit ClpA